MSQRDNQHDHEEIRPDVSQSHQAAPEPSAAQIKRQMERILDSNRFRQAKSLEKFLRYVVTRKLDGAENELKEYTIGLEVFQRGADYDPRRDAVVRVQANVLRKRMASYYQEEGAGDELIIEMPKGHYVPRFHFRPGIAGLEDRVEYPDAPAERRLSPAQSGGDSARVPTPVFIAMTFILGLLTAFAFQHWRGDWILAEKNIEGAPKPAATVDPVYLPLWGKFFEPGAENLLAYGTPQFFTADGVYLRDVEVNSPQEGGLGSRLMSLRKASHLDFQPTEIYTGVGETHGVYLLTRFFSKAARELSVTRSRMVGWNEMKNANVIFLSSMRFHTLAKDLPYPSDFVINQGTRGAAIINLRPAADESATYGGTVGEEYAALTVWPGKLHQRRIVILSGSTTWATMAAAEYVTDPEYLLQLNQHLEQCRLKAGSARHAPYFQALLRAEVKDNHPISISYVTHHDLQIADQSDEPAKLPNNQQVLLRRH
ncbi:MAG TPA: hypothetical protein VFV58_10825 [Blastocatellia bacterium]|jgi:hypothetical protein|nr:hypothetical protein [Blastocatellia bacterium]